MKYTILRSGEFEGCSTARLALERPSHFFKLNRLLARGLNNLPQAEVFTVAWRARHIKLPEPQSLLRHRFYTLPNGKLRLRDVSLVPQSEATSSSPDTLFLPRFDLSLPFKLKMNAVPNDETLRDAMLTTLYPGSEVRFTEQFCQSFISDETRFFKMTPRYTEMLTELFPIPEAFPGLAIEKY